MLTKNNHKYSTRGEIESNLKSVFVLQLLSNNPINMGILKMGLDTTNFIKFRQFKIKNLFVYHNSQNKYLFITYLLNNCILLYYFF